MRWVATQVKNGSFLMCPQGSHMAMWDDQRTYAFGLVRFLRAVDRREDQAHVLSHSPRLR